ncbi:hypothetical protein [Lyngbya confervoides]|uniref:Uncharacterized protein n=1 Tax=Lyngbya confervoides BDU141951 TaxID=1574623 RepID=A0ABD4T5J1_9CYAN|nr:hypothetical protein [Lyngbya confervoides]MCM1983696.1 hypothetical protein [Lyngbya confervoides BDU141951]
MNTVGVSVMIAIATKPAIKSGSFSSKHRKDGLRPTLYGLETTVGCGLALVATPHSPPMILLRSHRSSRCCDMLEIIDALILDHARPEF